MTLLIVQSKQGELFLKSLEGYRAKPYKLEGEKLYTVAWGLQITDAQAVQWKDGITPPEAQVIYNNYIDNLCKQLSKYPLANFAQNQYDALIAFTFNIGMGTFQGSTIFKQLSIRATDLTPWKFYIYDSAGKRSIDLVKRRELELRLFIYNIY